MPSLCSLLAADDGGDAAHQAVTQIDQITQQNAALVEEATAAAKNMEDQSEALVRSVTIFKLTKEKEAARGPGLHGARAVLH